MARYNASTTKNAPRTPVRTASSATADAVTHEGAPGWLRDEKSELFLAAVTDLNEDLFYESAGDRAARVDRLIQDVATNDPAWVLGLVGWLRSTAGLRSSAVNVAVAAAHARVAAGSAGSTRQIVDAAIARADEPAELLACWIARHGRTIPSSVKRGVSDAVRRTWNESSVLKWRGKGARGDLSMRDVLNLAHPSAKDDHQAALFEAILAEAYGREADLTALPVMKARAEFLSLEEDDAAARLSGVGAEERIRAAALTHEVIAGKLGVIPAAVWATLVPRMGYTALMMNLRRMLESGVGDEVVREVSGRLADPDEVRRSGVMPVKLLSAYRNAPLEFAAALQRAMEVSTENVPALKGRTLVLVDCSGSMGAPLSERGTLTRMDAASVFGAALALRGEDVTLVRFGSRSEEVAFRRGDGVLRLSDRMTASMGGTNTRGAVGGHYAGHDRVIVLTDEQAGYGYYGGGDVFASVPEKVHAFTWNLAGYRAAHAPSGAHRHAFGGLSDAGFGLISRVETGFAGKWPWEE